MLKPLLRKLASSPICRSLTESEIETIFAIAEERHVPKGTYVFEEGQPAEVLMVIAMGRVEITRQKRVLATPGIGDVLGELSLFSYTHKRSASARALTDVTVLSVSSVRFRKLVEADNLAALKVVNNLAHQMSDRVLALTDMVLAASEKKDLIAVRGRLTW